MELFRALAAFVEPPTAELAGLAELLELGRAPTDAEHTELFVFQLNPCASIYLGAEGMLGGEARDRIAGFWRAIGQTPPAEPDHLAVMLALAARLSDLEGAQMDQARQDAFGRAHKAFFWEHLASWLPVYLSKARDVGAAPYAAWADLALAALAEDAERLGPPDRLSIHLRDAPALDDPRAEGSEAFLGTVLAPVRSGILLTRHDLAGAARELGLGLRLGERRFALRSLIDQDAQVVLTWLADYAAQCRTRYERHATCFGETACFWIERAGQTERLLRTLVTDLGHGDTETRKTEV